MANAKRDANYIPTLLGLSNADGITPVIIKCDCANTYSLAVSDGTSGSDNGGDHAVRDDNNVPVMIAVSSDDGITPVAIYADPSTGAVLIKST